MRPCCSGKRAHGSLRFLFLDEANRLSPDNLGVLFDLVSDTGSAVDDRGPEVAPCRRQYDLSLGAPGDA